MKRLIIIVSFLLLNIISSHIFATPRMATVTGNVFLSDSTNHSGVKVLFESISASATTDSVYSGTDGSYAIGLTDGIYNVLFLKNGFIPHTLPNYAWGDGSYTLPDVTLSAGSVVEVSGDVNGTWYNNTLIRVTDNINVPTGDTLIIQPGVTVEFMGSYRLYVYGSILAVGTETDSIFFTSGQAIKSPTDWQGIYISGNDTTETYIFQYCNFGYGGTSGMIYTLGTDVSVKILNSYIHNVGGKTFRFRRSHNIVSDCKIVAAGNPCFDFDYVKSLELKNSVINIQDGYLFNLDFHHESEYSYKALIAGNTFSNIDYSYFGHLYNNETSDPNDSLIIRDNTFSYYLYIRTEGSNYTLLENNTFQQIHLQENDVSKIINNKIDAGITFQSNASSVLYNNLIEGSIDFQANNGGSQISYNNFYSANINNVENGPIGFGDILTVNVNGDSADTYLNIFEQPIFVPSDSTIYLSWAYQSPNVTVNFTPRQSWYDTTLTFTDSVESVALQMYVEEMGQYSYLNLTEPDQEGGQWTGTFDYQSTFSVGYGPTYIYFSIEFASGWHYPNTMYGIDFLSPYVEYMAYSQLVDENSPVVDAGNPAVQYNDPDGTVADIGRYYYAQTEPAAPVADFTSSSTSGVYPLFVEFTSTSTGPVNSYSWNFGDGNTSTGFRPVHPYNATGTYTVSLTVTGPGGTDIETKTDYITVTAPSLPPIVSFTADPTNGTVPFDVAFTSNIYNSVDSVKWTFGDGGVSTATNPSHTYTTAGAYTVTMIGYNSYGSDTLALNEYINALDPTAVLADFSATPLLGVAPLSVSFTNVSIGTADSVKWTFGDGNESSLASPIHTYDSSGVFDVSMIVYGELNNDTVSSNDYISVYDSSPIITSIVDAPNDQGGMVILQWDPSGWDGPVGATITQYSLWEDYNSQWVNINNAMATQLDSYMFLASTFGDSTASAGIHWSKFKVLAHTADPAVFYSSPIDSGYSMDNIPPESPGHLTATSSNNVTVLDWGTSNEANFMYYEVLRNNDVIGQLTETSYTESDSTYPMPGYYKVHSVDDAGNVSPPTNEVLVDRSSLDWFVNVRASLDLGSQDNYNFLGTATDATNGFDTDYDIFEPPDPPGSYVTASFYAPDLDSNQTYDNFAQLVNPTVALGDTMQLWELHVTANVDDTVSLSFNFEGIPSLPVIIEDMGTGVRHPITASSDISFLATADSLYMYKVSIGDTTSPTLTLGPSCVGPLILNSGNNHTFSWSLSDGNGIDSLFAFISLDSGQTFTPLYQSNTFADSVDWLVEDAEVITGAMFSLHAKDYAGNQASDQSAYFFAIAGDSLSVDISSGWTLLGVPMVPGNALADFNLSDDITGYWSLYGFENGGYIFDSSFVSGKGYWLATLSDANIDVLGEPLLTDKTLDMVLGWNLVSDPLVLDISVDSLLFMDTSDSILYTYSEALASGWVNGIYGFDGDGYVDISTLKSWNGYWIGMLSEDLQMIMPIHKAVSDTGSQRNDENGWEIAVEGFVDGARDVTTFFGVEEDGTEGFDPVHDVFKAPDPPGDSYVTMFFDYAEWNLILGNRIAKDKRSPIEPEASKDWELVVNSSEPYVTLKWYMDNVPGDYEIGYRLTGEEYYTDMTQVDSITVSSGSILSFNVGYHVLGVGDKNLLPTVFSLYQNYPNPFNPITKINYDLPEQSDVTITIYDMLGRQVKTLVNQTQDAGYRSIIWNATNDYGKPVSAGIYLYQIQAGDYISTKKMVLLK